MPLRLTKNNYYSQAANQAYWSSSFVKAMLSCPARAMAELHGEYVPPSSTALLVGSYVDAWFGGKREFARFLSSHPEFFHSKTGDLKSEFRKADNMIHRATQDPLFMEYCKGRKQAIKTGTISGVPFKCKMDFYQSGIRIADLKTVKDMNPMYSEGQGKVSFAEYWGWTLQMSIYQILEGHSLPCYLNVITKEDPPNIEVIQIPQHILDTEMEILIEKIPYLDAIRRGIIPAERCEKCSYCRATKKLTEPVSLDEFNDW